MAQCRGGGVMSARARPPAASAEADIRVQALQMALSAGCPADRIVPLAFEIATFVSTGAVVSAGEGGARAAQSCEGQQGGGVPSPPALPTGRRLDVLQAMVRMARAGEKITMHTVADATTVDPQTANKHMNALVDDGWVEKRLNSSRNRAHWHVRFPDAVPAPADSKPLATREAIRLFCQAHGEWLTVEELRRSVNGDPSVPLVELVELGKLQRRFEDGALQYRAVQGRAS